MIVVKKGRYASEMTVITGCAAGFGVAAVRQITCCFL
jgi:hypothetical protein